MNRTVSLDESSAVVPLLPIHPLARALPPMTAEEFDLLKADIRLQGLLEPITLLDGAVLDGIHRQRACSELGIKPQTVLYSGHSPAAFVLSRNVRRRHLSVGQQAAAGEALVRYYQSKFPSKQNTSGADLAKVAADLGLEALPESSGTAPVGTVTLVANAVGIQPQAIETFSTLRKQEPRLAEEVRAGTKSLYGADAERKAAAKEATQTDVSRRQTDQEAGTAAAHALLDAIRVTASKVRACEVVRRNLSADYMAGALKAAEQMALELRRLVLDIQPLKVVA